MAMWGSTTSARAREMWRVLRRWERTGLTLAEFGRREGIALTTLGWWRHVFRRADTGNHARPRRRRVYGAAREHSGPEPRFVELTMAAAADAPAARAVLEMVLRSGSASSGAV